MPPSRPSRRAKAGVTLVEVMLAGALTVVAALATFEGFIVATRIAHENALTLRADGIAFDLLWRKFYGDYETMTSTVGKTPVEKNTQDQGSPYRQGLTSSVTNIPQYAYYESVSNYCGGKILSIDLKYGANNQFTRHLEVFRSDIPRTAISN